MRKIYIGILVSLIFILGGSLLFNYYRPEVDSSRFNQAFYRNAENYYMDYDNQITLVEASKDRIKVIVNFKNMNGKINTSDIFERIRWGNNTDPNFKERLKNIDEFYNSKNVKKEVVKFKWVTKPKNMDLVKVMAEEVVENGKYNYTKFIYESFKDKEIGEFESIKGKKGGSDYSVFYGIGGNGTVELEIVNVYK